MLKLRILIGGCLFAFLVPLAGVSQVGGGQIQGICRDPEGASIPGVNITLRHVDTGIERILSTDEIGRFSAPFTAVGGYNFRAESPGMAPLNITGLVLTVGATRDIACDMKPAGLQQEISVIGEAPAVLTSRTEASSTLNEIQIQNLPINGRRWENFALLTPGATNDGNFGLVSFHGIAGVFNNTLIDGADNNQAFFAEERGRTRIAYPVSQDSIREFQVNTSNYSAEFGRAAGGVVNAVTRSGTNEYHGTAFYYLRDSSFLARDPFARALNQAKPEERRHQFGASLGGPISRDKVFFFLSYDQQNRNFPVTVLPNGGEVFYSGSTAPATATQQSVNFLRSLTGVFPRNANQYLGFGKVDWQLTDNHRLTTSLNMLDFRSKNGVQTAGVVAVPLSSNGNDGVKTETLVSTFTSVLSPSMANEARFQYSRDFEFQTPNGVGPSVTISNSGGSFQYGMPNFLPRPAYPKERRFQLADNFSFLMGAHDFKVGADINLIRDEFTNLFQGGGVYNYQSLTAFAQDYGVVDTGTTTGKHYNSYSQAFDVIDPSGRNQFSGIDYNFYGQDNIRLTPEMTLNLGVRYEYQAIPQPTNPNPLLPLTASLHRDKNNFGPRFGFAWQLLPETVFRMGYGLSFGRTQHSTISNLIVNNGVTQRAFQLFPATAGSPVFPAVLSAPPTTAGAVTINLAAADFVNPEVHTASAEFEHEIFSGLTVAARYMAARGTHLPNTRDTNIAPATSSRSYNVLDAGGAVVRTISVPFYNTRLNPAFGPLLTYESGVSSWYHGLAILANKRFSHNIQFMSSLTWSHALDDGQSSFTFLPGNTTLDPWNRRDDYGNSSLDQRRRFVFSGLWHPAVGGEGMRHAILSGWKLGGIVTLADGVPQTGTIQLGTLVGGLGGGLNASNTTNNRFPGMGRNTFVRPGLNTVDLRLAREFRFSEAHGIEALIEGFNIFNRVNYATVNATQYILQGTNLVPNAAFLNPLTAYSYPAAGNPRQIQLAVRYNFR